MPAFFSQKTKNMANKYAAINPADLGDRKALFDLICKDICMLKKSEVLGKLLGIEGGSASVRDYVPDMNDICKILELYDVEHEFKVTYSELKTDNDKKFIEHRDNVEERSVSEARSMKVCDEYKDMKKQAEEIKIPELKHEVVSLEKKDESFVINMTQMPDGPDFLT